MNVKLGQLDLFSPLCKICEKTELCSQGLADERLMLCPSRSGQCPDYGKLPGYKSVCVYYYKMLRNNMNNWAINLYKENNSQAILSRKGRPERISKGHLSNDFYNLVLYVVSRRTVRAWGPKRGPGRPGILEVYYKL